MVQGLEIPFDRVTYRDGQLLAASDLQSDQNRNSRLWELHTRYLHDSWGIAIGFQVSANVSDTLVQVQPGYAVDQLGRPLVSSVTVPVTVPNVSATQVLVIHYQSNAFYRERRGLEGLCLGDPSTQQESPAFDWKAPADVQMGLDIPLITLQLTGGAIQSTDPRARRYAQKLQRPYIASGATDQGSTVWSQLATAVPQGFTLYQTTIDTSDAAFNSTPYYFAELHMWNNAPSNVYGVVYPKANTDFVDFGGALTFIGGNPAPDSNSFIFNLIVPASGNATGADPNASGWSVSWIGIEVASCEPEFNLILGLLLNFRPIFPLFPFLKAIKL